MVEIFKNSVNENCISIMRLTGINFFVIVIMSGVLLFACISKTNTNKKDEDANIDTQPSSKIVSVNNRQFNIPSPLQVADQVKMSEIKYNKKLLNSPLNASKYNTNLRKALNLGIYGADLGYLNVYDQMQDAIQYLTIIKKIVSELGILTTLEDRLLRRFENNKSNKDSIMFLMGDLYRASDLFLLNNDRNDVAVLILAGGWIESLYFLTNCGDNKNMVLYNRIGEQKQALDNLIEIMRPYYNAQSEDYDKLLKSLIELATIFDGITIEYSYQKSTVDTNTKTTVINCKSKTIITDYQFKNIKRQIIDMREKIIS